MFCNQHRSPLTRHPLDKMAAISQTTFSNASSWINNFVFWLKFHRRFFLRANKPYPSIGSDNGLGPIKFILQYVQVVNLSYYAILPWIQTSTLHKLRRSEAIPRYILQNMIYYRVCILRHMVFCRRTSVIINNIGPCLILKHCSSSLNIVLTRYV